MTAIPGVTITQNNKGKFTSINIDLIKHPEAIAVLKNIGLVPATNLEEDLADCITPEELHASIDQLITTHYEGTHQTQGAKKTG